MRQFYTDTVLPTLSESRWRAKFPSPPAASFAGFLHSYSLVSSRSFLVDAYHALAMVPIADAFNHTAENHVHLEVRSLIACSPAFSRPAGNSR